jgi:hypothetical protein
VRKHQNGLSLVETCLALVLAAVMLIVVLPKAAQIETERNSMRTSDLMVAVRESQEFVKARCGGYPVDFGPMLGRPVNTVIKLNHAIELKPGPDRKTSSTCPDMNGYLTSSYAVSAVPINPKVYWKEYRHFLANPLGVFTSQEPIQLVLDEAPPEPARAIYQVPDAHGVTTSVK